jgi:pilus assembly protein Flp/PilA
MQGCLFFKRLWRNSQGATGIEYGLILSLIVIGLIAAVGGVARETLLMWTHVQQESAKAHGTN